MDKGQRNTEVPSLYIPWTNFPLENIAWQIWETNPEPLNQYANKVTTKSSDLH